MLMFPSIFLLTPSSFQGTLEGTGHPKALDDYSECAMGNKV